MTDHPGGASRLALEWLAIADALGLRIVAPASVVLPATGTRIDADVLLPDFGAPRGMLLVADVDLVWEHRNAIVDAGFGFSVLGYPWSSPDSAPDVDIAIDALRDWGWAGRPEDRPAWMSRRRRRLRR